jgi:hypothetical protein
MEIPFTLAPEGSPEDKITLFKLLTLDPIQEVYPELHFKKERVGAR